MIFPVYKPSGPTSHDIIHQIRNITGVKTVGHAGTLDPLAEGVLVVGIGRNSTKQLGSIVKKEKEYEARIRLGMTSTTDDEEGEKKTIFISDMPTKAQIEETIKKFTGMIQQVPPLYSAVKVSGKEAYKFARRGQSVFLKPRNVEIKEILITRYQWPFLDLDVVTGPGVYIRALARDLGASLGVGGYLAKLKRVRVGDFAAGDAVSINKLESFLKKQYIKL